MAMAIAEQVVMDTEPKPAKFIKAYENHLHEKGEPITEEHVDQLAEEMKRLGFRSACALIRVSYEGMRKYLLSHPEAVARVQRAKAEYIKSRIEVVEDPGDGKGASAKGKGNLGILAAFDERFRPKQRIDHHVEGEVLHRPVFAPVDITGSKALTAQDHKALPGPASDVDELLDGDADSMTLDVELGASESVESEPTPDCESSEPLTVEENGVIDG